MATDILIRKQFIIANQPHIETLAQAPLQSFSTDMAAPLKECKVYFNPMQEGEGTPSPNNVMAITGWNKITISQFQRQVIQDATNEDWTVGWLTAGGMLNASASYRTSDYIPVLSGTTVKIKFTNQTNERAWYCIAYYDSQKKFLIRNNQGYITEDITCTVSYEGLKYIRISINRASDVLISIEPITTYLIDWSSTGTVYGGYIDLLTGEVWKTWDIVSSSVLSDWLLNRTSLLYESGKAIRCYCPENGAGSAIKWTVQCTHFSDVGPVGNWAKDAERKDGYVVEAQGRSIMFIASGLGFTTKQEWAQWMVDNNVQYVYPLAAPVLITALTPTQIKTFRGTNNIYSTANGNIDIKYWTH